MPEQRNKKILDEVKAVTHRDLVTILKEVDHELVKGALRENTLQNTSLLTARMTTSLTASTKY